MYARARLFLVCLILACFSSSFAAPAKISYAKLALSFEPNRGQADTAVKFLARGRGYSLALTNDSAVFVLRGRKKSSMLRLAWVGSNSQAAIEGESRLLGTVNYFRGKDQAKWLRAVPTFARARYQNLYPGIDLVLYGSDRQLEYDLVAAPGADLAKLDLQIFGADSLRLDSNGDLLISTAAGELRQKLPAIYQRKEDRRQSISGHYVLRASNHVGFAVAAYDRSLPLVLDPILVWATDLGGSKFEDIHDIALDASGNVFVFGITNSPDFPLQNAADGALSGTQDTFISKLSNNGSQLLYSTYLGGTESGTGEGAVAIAVDPAGSAYVTGSTVADDFPITPAAFQKSRAGGRDVFVTKLSPTGTLVYSTYLGGKLEDGPGDIAIDSLGRAYVVGETHSFSFPTKNAFQATHRGGTNTWTGFVTRLEADGSALSYSTYLGGSNSFVCCDSVTSVAVDSSYHAYITGGAWSPDFPVTAGTYRTTPVGQPPLYVAKLWATGQGLTYSTFFGGSAENTVTKIAIDSSNRAYITGYTNSTDFPVTTSAAQKTFHGHYDIFASSFNWNGTALFSSTLLGGAGNDQAFGLAVNRDHEVFVSGLTNSGGDWPLLNAMQIANPGSAYPGSHAYSGFVIKLSPLGSLRFSSFIGDVGGQNLLSETDSQARGLAIDSANRIYVGGEFCCGNGGNDFPTTAGAYQIKTHGGAEGFVAAIDLANGSTTCAPPTTDHAVNVCFPADGGSVNSPFDVEAAAFATSGVNQMQMWVDSKKTATVSADRLRSTLILEPGSHRITVFGRDTNGASFSKVVAVTEQQ